MNPSREREQIWQHLQEQAFAALLADDLTLAETHFQHAYITRYGQSWKESSSPQSFWSQPAPPLPQAVPLAKLHHDLEQLDYLLQTGSLPAEHFAEHRQALAKACLHQAQLYPHVLPEQALPLDKLCQNLLSPIWGRNLWRNLSLPTGPLLNPATDFERISADYHRNAPGFALSDQLLSPECLQNLLDFCQRATIWNDYGRGAYVGSYLWDGFCSPLILRLGQALRQQLPKVLPYVMTVAWSYKYDSGHPGVGLHADSEGRINVNFWLTPESANLQPQSGGLMLYDVLAPEDWHPKTYQYRMNELFRPGEFKAYSVPYRQNRVQFFNSQLFHQSEPFQFKPGYLNRRLNVTLIFGFRRAEQANQHLFRWPSRRFS